MKRKIVELNLTVADITCIGKRVYITLCWNNSFQGSVLIGKFIAEDYESFLELATMIVNQYELGSAEYCHKLISRMQTAVKEMMQKGDSYMLGRVVYANMTESKLNYLVCEYKGYVYRLMPNRHLVKASAYEWNIVLYHNI